MKKQYEEAQMDVIYLDADVVTDSLCPDENVDCPNEGPGQPWS